MQDVASLQPYVLQYVCCVPYRAGTPPAPLPTSWAQLALKLHPDKNKALHSDEAFKAVSKAFNCLSDGDKRAYYDRTGHESSAAVGGRFAGWGCGGMNQRIRLAICKCRYVQWR